MDTGMIILAAGNSSRLGQPKQLLTYQGKTLLTIVSEEALKTSYRPIIVVLGAYADEISKAHRDPRISYVVNDNWQAGMASSIFTGLTALLDNNKALENVIIAVADQVFITARIFENLTENYQLTSKGIVASSYGETEGTPVLFNKKYFAQLLQLEGNKGAKKILAENPSDMSTVSFEKGHIDIDTATDYHNLNQNQ
ncbi:nucleotidyltransferase family protein [Pedobacter rhizosphaerae]|uniref:Molybdenum cofactor cytidylyltransferase n=1 Tax=Pedobacter rhizosphaerae TaxID=390241 RepID=A0A1H9MR31_9SPHI|nr:nucleotidyltransferase family protein [Pedobacter rhizosphaerae]SER25875.1 molybdenum cofactor cytidylyltransferase [Pedobacter rhizosphaerae]